MFKFIYKGVPPLLNKVAPANILLISITLDTFQIITIWLNEVAPANMLLRYINPEVSWKEIELFAFSVFPSIPLLNNGELQNINEKSVILYKPQVYKKLIFVLKTAILENAPHNEVGVWIVGISEDVALNKSWEFKR